MKEGQTSGMKPILSLALTTAIGLCAVSCSARPPSDDSRYLTKVVVSKVTAWATGSEPVFDLSKEVIARNYDHLCLVGEYTSLPIIEGSLGFEITDYHSDFGVNVGELKWALVGVKRGKAHAALGDALRVNLNLVPGSVCAPADRAKLIRFPGRSVGLETSDASGNGSHEEVQ